MTTRDMTTRPRHRGGRPGRARGRRRVARATRWSPPITPRLDVGRPRRRAAVITSSAPDVVVHAGAWTAVDACEGDPDRAFRVNALGDRYVAEGARRVGRPPVLPVDRLRVRRHEAGAVRRVGRRRTRVSVYGRSKLGGEREVGRRTRRSCARRGCAAQHGSNMVKTILRLAAEHETLALRRRPARLPDVHRRPGADAAPARRRPAAGHLPRHQPGRGVAGSSSPSAVLDGRGPGPGVGSGRSRPPTSSRPARRPARPTPCSTTPRSASPGSPSSPTTASRSSVSCANCSRDRRRRNAPGPRRGPQLQRR